MATVTITQQNFEQTLKSNEIVLIDFWASWCGPCRMFGPIFESASNKHPDIVFGKIDTEDQQELASAFSIRSIPTFMVFRQNILLFSQPGLIPEEALDDIIKQVRALDMNKVKEEINNQNKQTLAGK